MSGTSKETPLKIKMPLKLGEHIDGGEHKGTTRKFMSSPLRPIDGCLHGQRAFVSRGSHMCWDPIFEEAEAEDKAT